MKPFPIEEVQSIDLVKYCGASGDFNPIHTIEKVAKEKKHPDILVPGMMLMGWATQAINTWFPGKKMKSFHVRFCSPVYSKESLKVVCTSKKNTVAGEQKCTLEIVNQTGEKKMTGKFEIATEIEGGNT
ncbi:MaoC family dehydratase [Thalassobacillus devorans]|uniref:MaoC family dehydratase n=1 Tax=Thalassobacillus devorans TaxID=279813 RepID=A0ABQ1P2C7_9BACI|nr:MaoC/PaaZ C-terminal domain-containing protein [Thalassobacillus devorans]NIK28034.1 acyl dehydratase [Thalassobacillus devorans]GGC89417.1 MaoC family dehydratase [Thalassobacillus devorans]